MSNFELQEKAVKAATRFIERKGYELLETGWTSPEGTKIDLIANDEDTLAFIDCVLSSSRRQNRRYDFDTFGVSRADLFFYSRDLPSISAFSILLLAPPNSTSLPWCMMRSMMAEASLSSPNTTPHLLNSIFVVITRLRFS